MYQVETIKKFGGLELVDRKYVSDLARIQAGEDQITPKPSIIPLLSDVHEAFRQRESQMQVTVIRKSQIMVLLLETVNSVASPNMLFADQVVTMEFTRISYFNFLKAVGDSSNRLKRI